MEQLPVACLWRTRAGVGERTTTCGDEVVCEANIRGARSRNPQPLKTAKAGAASVVVVHAGERVGQPPISTVGNRRYYYLTLAEDFNECNGDISRVSSRASVEPLHHAVTELLIRPKHHHNSRVRPATWKGSVRSRIGRTRHHRVSLVYVNILRSRNDRVFLIAFNCIGSELHSSFSKTFTNLNDRCIGWRAAICEIFQAL